MKSRVRFPTGFCCKDWRQHVTGQQNTMFLTRWHSGWPWHWSSSLSLWVWLKHSCQLVLTRTNSYPLVLTRTHSYPKCWKGTLWKIWLPVFVILVLYDSHHYNLKPLPKTLTLISGLLHWCCEFNSRNRLQKRTNPQTPARLAAKFSCLLFAHYNDQQQRNILKT